ncbi:hypothetical protein ANN_13113 [Periplaneta americana]|uniref:Uncharacterized protein n=1 Tax=Periplaneta americana TaxID=6978 RepID=A0ABQ8TL24_PERAM|nr:hypothetical protein ANN_13113 [Periplaneta americana]
MGWVWEKGENNRRNIWRNVKMRLIDIERQEEIELQCSEKSSLHLQSDFMFNWCDYINSCNKDSRAVQRNHQLRMDVYRCAGDEETHRLEGADKVEQTLCGEGDFWFETVVGKAPCKADLNNFKGKLFRAGYRSQDLWLNVPALCQLSYPGTPPVTQKLYMICDSEISEDVKPPCAEIRVSKRRGLESKRAWICSWGISLQFVCESTNRQEWVLENHDEQVADQP